MSTFIMHHNEAPLSTLFFMLNLCVTSVCLFQYMCGFGNEFSSEDPRCPGALPEGQVTRILLLLHILQLDIVRGLDDYENIY